MADPHQFLLDAHRHATAWKTERVQTAGAKAPVPFIVVANRGSEQVAVFYPPGRDGMLWCMSVAVGAFGCDLVAGTVDAYAVRGDPKHPTAMKINPDTGRDWGQGDMARAFDRKRPWVVESMMTHAIDKVEREVGWVSQDYRAKHHVIKWRELIDGRTQGLVMGGLVPDALEKAMAAPDVMAEIGRLTGGTNLGLSPKAARAHGDVVAIRLCAKMSVPVKYNVSDPDVRGIVEMSLGDEARNAAMGAPGLHLTPIISGL